MGGLCAMGRARLEQAGPEERGPAPGGFRRTASFPRRDGLAVTAIGASSFGADLARGRAAGLARPRSFDLAARAAP